MTIVILIIYVFALVACVTAPKVWHRAAMLIVTGIITYFICSSIIAAHKKVADGMFRYHHVQPLQAFLGAVHADIATGHTNAALQKLSVAKGDCPSMWVLRTNVTFRTVNQKLGISEQPAGAVTQESARSAAP